MNMNELIETIQQLQKEINEIVENVKEEMQQEVTLEDINDDETKDENELIEMIEKSQEKMKQKQQINEQLMKRQQELADKIKEMNETFVMMKREKENENIKLKQKHNEMIDLTQTVKFRKLKKEIEKNPDEKNKLVEEFKEEKTKELKDKFDEEEIEKGMKKMEENNNEMKFLKIKKEIEKMTQLKEKEIIFDSNKDNWSENNSEFSNKLKGKKNVCILIEDENGNKYGGFVSSEIEIGKFINDKDCFVFSLEKNNEIKQQRFNLQPNGNGLFICEDEGPRLFGFGGEIVDGNVKFRDIFVPKKEKCDKAFCSQHSFEYGEEKNALTGDIYCTIKRIVAFEMKEKAEVSKKMILIQPPQQQEEPVVESQIEIPQQQQQPEVQQEIPKKELPPQQPVNIEDKIVDLTGKVIKEKIFDSSVDNWSIENSDLHAKIEARKNLCFVIEDENCNIFGGFVKNEMQLFKKMKDPKSFIFSIRKNGIAKNVKYTWRNSNVSNNLKGSAFIVYDEHSEYLFVFGIKKDNSGESFKDIVVKKKGVQSLSYCNPFCFDYKNNPSPLCGDSLEFIPKKIEVYQMESKDAAKKELKLQLELEKKQEKERLELEKQKEKELKEEEKLREKEMKLQLEREKRLEKERLEMEKQEQKLLKEEEKQKEKELKIQEKERLEEIKQKEKEEKQREKELKEEEKQRQKELKLQEKLDKERRKELEKEEKQKQKEEMNKKVSSSSSSSEGANIMVIPPVIVAKKSEEEETKIIEKSASLSEHEEVKEEIEKPKTSSSSEHEEEVKEEIEKPKTSSSSEHEEEVKEVVTNEIDDEVQDLINEQIQNENIENNIPLPIVVEKPKSKTSSSSSSSKEEIEKPQPKIDQHEDLDALLDTMEEEKFNQQKKEEEEEQRRWLGQKIPIQNGLKKITEMEVEDVIFDGSKDKWNVNDSEFAEKLDGKENVSIIVEDEDGNIFGCYIKKQIASKKLNMDEERIIFSIKRDGFYNPVKYSCVKEGIPFYIHPVSNENLFSFGVFKEEGRIVLADLVIAKKDSESESQTKQIICNYKGTPKALCGNETFKVKNLLVYQMKESEEFNQIKTEQLEDPNNDLIIEGLKTLLSMQVKEELFNSEIHRWNIRDSEFIQRLMGKRNIAIVVIDENNNAFGGYVTKPIQMSKFHYDEKCVLFSLKQGGRLNPIKFDKKPNQYDLIIEYGNSPVLFAFGADEENNSILYRDICVYKKDTNGQDCICLQHSFDYGNRSDFLCGGRTFTVKKILAYQMEYLPEVYEFKIQQERNEEKNELMKEEQLLPKIKKEIEKVTGCLIESVLFDSTRQSWAMKNSNFRTMIEGKSNVCITIEDCYGCVFGGFISKRIVTNQWLKDPNTIVFTVKKEDQISSSKYKCKSNGLDFYLYDDNHHVLFTFGGQIIGDKQIEKDIGVYKSNFPKDNVCSQYSYDYHGDVKCLCGRTRFGVKKIVVYQMKDLTKRRSVNALNNIPVSATPRGTSSTSKPKEHPTMQRYQSMTTISQSPKESLTSTKQSQTPRQSSSRQSVRQPPQLSNPLTGQTTTAPTAKPKREEIPLTISESSLQSTHKRHGSVTGDKQERRKSATPSPRQEEPSPHHHHHHHSHHKKHERSPSPLENPMTGQKAVAVPSPRQSQQPQIQPSPRQSQQPQIQPSPRQSQQPQIQPSPRQQQAVPQQYYSQQQMQPSPRQPQQGKVELEKSVQLPEIMQSQMVTMGGIQTISPKSIQPLLTIDSPFKYFVTTFAEDIIYYDGKKEVKRGKTKVKIGTVGKIKISDMSLGSNSKVYMCTDKNIQIVGDGEPYTRKGILTSCCEFHGSLVGVSEKGLKKESGGKEVYIKKLTRTIELANPVKIRASINRMFILDTKIQQVVVLDQNSVLKGINIGNAYDMCCFTDTDFAVLGPKGITLFHVSADCQVTEKVLKCNGLPQFCMRIEGLKRGDCFFMLVLSSDGKTVHKIVVVA